MTNNENSCDIEVSLSTDLWIVLSQIEINALITEEYDYKLYLEVYDSTTSTYTIEDTASPQNTQNYGENK